VKNYTYDAHSVMLTRSMHIFLQTNHITEHDKVRLQIWKNQG